MPDAKTRLGQVAIRLRKLDTSTVYPVLLLLAAERAGDMPELEFDAILNDLESYLIRRTVCGLPIKQYNRFFLSLLQSLRKAEQVNSHNVRDFLLAAQGESTVWPADKDFEKAWLRDPAYAKLGPSIAGMILEAIDQRLRTAKCEDISIHGSLTVEHVLPQGWAEHWPLDSHPADAVAGESAEDIRTGSCTRSGI